MLTARFLLQLEFCPKCGRSVSLENNGALLDLIVQEHPAPLLAMMVTQAFHLLPLVQQGRLLCPGSPSRSQYLPGQPRDTRPHIMYRSERQSVMRAAFAEMQRLRQASLAAC